MLWIVEQRRNIGGAIAPIRSVVECDTKKQAKAGAQEAVDKAVEHLCSTRGIDPKMITKAGPVVVLYSQPGSLRKEDE